MGNSDEAFLIDKVFGHSLLANVIANVEVVM